MLLTLIPYHYQQISRYLDIDITKLPNPYVEVKGWDQFGNQLGEVLGEYPDATLLSSERPLLAQAVYQVRPHPNNIVYWNPKRAINNHYAITTSIDDKLGKNFILVTSEPYPKEVTSRFKSMVKLNDISIDRDPYPDTRFYLFYLH